MRKIVVYEFLSVDGVAEAPERFFTDWDDAMEAAETATGMMNGIRVTPPPVAGFSRGEPTIKPSEPWYDHVLDIAGNVAEIALTAWATLRLCSSRPWR